MALVLSNQMVVEKMDLASIKLREQKPPLIVHIEQEAGFFWSDKFSHDRRIRAEVYEMLKAAQRSLPEGLHFMIFEAYRPLARQARLWDDIVKKMKLQHPDLPESEIKDLCENFIAYPYDGIGSGHQAACAVDATLCTSDGKLLEMGTAMHEFNDLTRTETEGLNDEARKNRLILKDALELTGFINYPAEWWHYSYGDHQWAWLVGKPEAFFGPLDLPEK